MTQQEGNYSAQGWDRLPPPFTPTPPASLAAFAADWAVPATNIADGVSTPLRWTNIIRNIGGFTVTGPLTNEIRFPATGIYLVTFGVFIAPDGGNDVNRTQMAVISSGSARGTRSRQLDSFPRVTLGSFGYYLDGNGFYTVGDEVHASIEAVIEAAATWDILLAQVEIQQVA